MGEQRRGRGGRGRSGRGGRIPRKGEGGQSVAGSDESFVSFPLDVIGPIRVLPALDEAAVTAVLRSTLQRENAQVAGVQALGPTGDTAVASLSVEIERHRDVLQQLARDLGADLTDVEPAGEAGTLSDLLAGQRLAYAGWQTLQRVAYMTGDKRVDRVVKPVLREKARHAEVIEEAAVKQSARSLCKEPEY